MSKTYRIEGSLQAEADFKSAFRWIAQRAPQQAHKWAIGLNTAIESLNNNLHAAHSRQKTATSPSKSTSYYTANVLIGIAYFLQLKGIA